MKPNLIRSGRGFPDTKHKENHKALWHSLALIISQVHDVEERMNVPEPMSLARLLKKLTVGAFTTKDSPEEIKELVEMAAQPTPVVENKTEDEYYPEPTVEVVPEPQPQQPPQPIKRTIGAMMKMRTTGTMMKTIGTMMKKVKSKHLNSNLCRARKKILGKTSMRTKRTRTRTTREISAS